MTQMRRVGDLRNVRYGEIIVLRKGDENFFAEVWNTMGYNDCPPDVFNAIDPNEAARQRDGIFTMKNGPRFWTFDTIESDPDNGWLQAPTETFSGLTMFLAATIQFGPELPERGPYLGVDVHRDNYWEFDAHKPRYYLVDPTGTRYILQAYAHYVDDTQTLEGLAHVGERLAMPTGWTFVTEQDPAHVLRVHTGPEKIGVILQDELGNSYMRCTHVEEV